MKYLVVETLGKRVASLMQFDREQFVRWVSGDEDYTRQE